MFSSCRRKFLSRLHVFIFDIYEVVRNHHCIISGFIGIDGSISGSLDGDAKFRTQHLVNLSVL
ncbi:MAG: hypothetical protein EBT89_08600 [Opitutaceae bacterium]|nr:hypothetical protein [Opitutaceae bacterium]